MNWNIKIPLIIYNVKFIQQIGFTFSRIVSICSEEFIKVSVEYGSWIVRAAKV